MALEVFARKGGMSEGAMRFELQANAPLAAYFVKIVAQAMSEVPA